MENRELNQKFDGLVNALRSVSLTDAEKTYIKNMLLNSADKVAAVRKSQEVRLTYESQRSILTNLIYKRMPIFLVITMLFGGGVSFAAENSLPGSLLYPIKVGVNERVGEVLALSTEAKANYEAKIAVRRMKEAEKLAEKGEMSPERASELKAKFEARTENVRARLDQLEAKGSLEAAIAANSDFQALLRARLAAMTDIAERDGDESNKVEIAKWLVQINNENGRSATIQLRMEAKMRLDVSDEVQARAEGKLRAAENKIAEVAKFIADNKASVSAEASAKAEAQLVLANNNLTAGKVKLEAKAYGEAFVLFNKAFSIAMEAKETIKDKKDRIRREELRIKADIKVGGENKMNNDEDAVDQKNSEDADHRTSSVSGEGKADVNSNNSGTKGNAEVRVKVGL